MINSKKFRRISIIAIMVLAFTLLITMTMVPSRFAKAEPDPKMVLDPVLTSTATESEDAGYYREINAGDVFTVTYRLVENNGMTEMLVTTAFDETYFRLTSFSVDENYYTLFNEYGHNVVDPVTQEVGFVSMTAAEFIAEHNAALDAEVEPYTDKLSFSISFKDGVRDPNGVTTDHFIVVSYVAVKNVPSGTHLSFGLDMSADGAFTNAALDADTLLDIVTMSGDPVSEQMVSFTVRSVATVSIPEGQVISFRRSDSSDEYLLHTSDIVVNFLCPLFEEGDPNPYLEDGGTITYLFYKKNDQNEFELIVDELQQSVLPTYATDNLYVKVVLSDSESYIGSETGPVQITASKLCVEIPDLIVYSSDREDGAMLDKTTLTLTVDGATYGSDLSLKEIVDDEEVIYSLPENGAAYLEDLKFTFLKKTGENSFEAFGENVNFFDVDNLPVGEYRLCIQPRDEDHVAFDGTDLTAININVIIAPKGLTLRTLIDGEAKVDLIYGDAAPVAFSATAEGFVSGDNAAELLAALALQVSSQNAYVQYAAVGEYVYTANVTGQVPSNYAIESNVTAKIVVSAKPLTIGVTYAGGVASFTFDGTLNNDEVTVTYSVDGTPLVGSEYAATAADLEKAKITATVTPVENTNYAAGSADLLAVKSVAFRAIGAFASAVMPETQYVFAGQNATQPTDPTFDRYAFRRWYLTDESLPYDFASAVEQNLTLTAAWEKMVFDFKFRALNEGADYATGSYVALAYENGEFVFSANSESYAFVKNTVIPRSVAIDKFHAARWVKAVKVDSQYTYTEVEKFEDSVSTETDADAFYIAIMTLDLGKGDLDGDGFVTAADVIRMKKVLVGVTYNVLHNVNEVWAKVGEEQPEDGYFYSFLWDVNADSNKDTRDVLVVREALATGYGYEIESNVTVNGVYYTKEIIVGPDEVAFEGEVTEVSDIDALVNAIEAGKKVGLIGDIEIENANDPLVFQIDKDVYIDLGGKTLTVDQCTLESSGAITIKNGWIDVANYLELDAEAGVTCFGLKKKSDGTDLEDRDGTDQTVSFTA